MVSYSPSSDSSRPSSPLTRSNASFYSARMALTPDSADTPMIMTNGPPGTADSPSNALAPKVHIKLYEFNSIRA